MRRSSFQKIDAKNASVDVMLSRDIISQYDKIAAVVDSIDEVVVVADSVDNVATVATNIGAVTAIGTHIDAIVEINDNVADVHIIADNIVNVNQVASNIGNINSVVNEVIPNIAEILQADDRAATATNMAVTATAQAALASTAKVAAEVAQGVAETKADEANLSMVAADISADLAAASASTASIKAGEASASATAAHNSELAAAAILDSFDDRYLGAFASSPTADNDGNALTNGALYFNTTTHNLRVYDAGLVDWIALSSVTFAGLQDVNLTSATTGDVLKWNGTDWVNTKTIGLNSLQLLGGTGTQGTMSWNADEETVDVIQNGAVLQLGQETQVHVRNNSGSSIADGKVVMATGTLGASGRITAGLYDGTSDVKYVLGVATETIAAGDDGKVTSFGKIRGINTSAWNEGDVLYTTAAGGLTNVVPTSGTKLAVAFVITKHAVNGTIMVRVNGVDELAYEPKSANIQSHIASTSNPHLVTKAQVGLGSADNTADANKNVLSATKWTTGKTITIGATGKTVDGSNNVSWSLAEIGAQASGNYQPLDATLTALADVTTASDKVIYATGVDTFGTSTLSAFGRTLIDDADATTARATLGVVIGTNVQAYDAGLLSIAGLTTAADKMIYTTALDTYATATVTAAARTILDDTSVAAMRTTLGISAINTPSTAVGGVVATNVQAAIAELDSEMISVNLLRADKYLAAQNIATMVYTGSDLTKIQYNNATDVDYEVLAYTNGDLTSTQHYIGSVLKGTTTLTYSSGTLVSAVFVGV